MERYFDNYKYVVMIDPMKRYFDSYKYGVVTLWKDILTAASM